MDVATCFANECKYRDGRVSGVLDSHRSVPIDLCSVPVLDWATPTICWASLIRVAPRMAKRECWAGCRGWYAKQGGSTVTVQYFNVRLQTGRDFIGRSQTTLLDLGCSVTLDLRSSSATERSDLAGGAKGLEDADIEGTKAKSRRRYGLLQKYLSYCSV